MKVKGIRCQKYLNNLLSFIKSFRFTNQLRPSDSLYGIAKENYELDAFANIQRGNRNKNDMDINTVNCWQSHRWPNEWRRTRNGVTKSSHFHSWIYRLSMRIKLDLCSNQVLHRNSFKYKRNEAKQTHTHKHNMASKQRMTLKIMWTTAIVTHSHCVSLHIYITVGIIFIYIILYLYCTQKEHADKVVSHIQ